MDAETNSSPAWQPFSKGPRNCIGQQMAMLEGKTATVLTLRWFDFGDAYGEQAESVERWGGPTYQIVTLTGRPKDAMPMRIKLREE